MICEAMEPYYIKNNLELQNFFRGFLCMLWFQI